MVYFFSVKIIPQKSDKGTHEWGHSLCTGRETFPKCVKWQNWKVQNSMYDLKTEGKKQEEREEWEGKSVCVFLCIGNTGMMMMHDKQ